MSCGKQSVPQSDESVAQEYPTRAFYKKVSYLQECQKMFGRLFRVRVCIRVRGCHLVCGERAMGNGNVRRKNLRLVDGKTMQD